MAGGIIFTFFQGFNIAVSVFIMTVGISSECNTHS
ncbi:hypothetical protein T01_6491 [Trichinella spiralis]|uniref:Uncharacterized protein n=1 Tax=Trichinella spiralis TaxID=6334 RepID=A0A0V1ALL7_TRISP|nr:hypothetical protein T01_6491 [Trichinella spiralis]